MMAAAKTDETEFEEQLNAFQADVAMVTRCYFAMAAINHLASQDVTLVGTLNEAPDFWNLVQTCHQTTLFISLGRVFDSNGDVRFTLNKLVGAAGKDGGAIFAANRLADRKRRSSTNAHEWLEDYLEGIHVPTTKEIRALKKVSNRYRTMFEETYRPIRHKIYAHGLATREEAVELFAETRIRELERIIRFLQRLGDGVWDLYWNGLNPLRRRPFPPMRAAQITDKLLGRGGTSDQEIIVEAVQKVMDQLGRR